MKTVYRSNQTICKIIERRFLNKYTHLSLLVDCSSLLRFFLHFPAACNTPLLLCYFHSERTTDIHSKDLRRRLGLFSSSFVVALLVPFAPFPSMVQWHGIPTDYRNAYWAPPLQRRQQSYLYVMSQQGFSLSLKLRLVSQKKRSRNFCEQGAVSPTQ